MSNFIYYEKLEDYEEQVRKAKECDKKDKEIERLNDIINKKEQFLGDNIKRLEREVVKRDNIINEFEEELKWQRKVCLSLNESFTVSIIDTLIDKLQELKGSDK